MYEFPNARPGRCKAMVSDETGWHHYQCDRKDKRDGWCGIHHPDAVEARRKKSDARYRAKMDAERAKRDTPALRIAELEGQVELLLGALRAVVAVADRKTAEFERAHAAIAMFWNPQDPQDPPNTPGAPA